MNHEVGRYRKIPVEIDAVQLTRANIGQVSRWVTNARVEVGEEEGDRLEELVIPTLEGEMRGSFGDWIVKGVEGEFYPVKPSIFHKTYEPVDD